MNVIIQAARFAHYAHTGIMRKWGGQPYITHPMRVAGMVTYMPCGDEIMVAAAWLHDTIEDVPHIEESDIRREFGGAIADLVGQVTNPSKEMKSMSRADRKAMDREFLAGAPRQAKILKMVDRLDNLRDARHNIPKKKLDWFEMYIEESEALIGVIGGAEQKLYKQIIDEIERCETRAAELKESA